MTYDPSSNGKACGCLAQIARCVHDDRDALQARVAALTAAIHEAHDADEHPFNWSACPAHECRVGRGEPDP